jgi:acetate kinase
LEQIRDCCKLAPLHNPCNLQGIELATVLLGTVPQVACFDTAFHAQIPFKAHMYGIPRDIAQKMSIRRYGFHGISYAYISSVVEDRRIVVAHLGSGCSASAIVNGVSIDTTMGFTPMEGLMMSTRSGSIDPGVILHIAREYGGDLEQISQILNKKSGLLGVSEITSDMKELLEIEKGSDDHRARSAHQAVEVFVYTVQKFISQLIMALNYDVDAIVFSGGIGENSPEIRARVMSAFSNLGILIDPYRNSRVPGNRIISMKQSKIKVMSIPTNEEKQIARDSVCAVDPNA